jgi:carboxylesterase
MTDSHIINPQLEGEDFFWQGNPTGVLLIHGFTATTSEVRPLAKKLHKRGYTTAGPLLPGHGTHPDDLNRAIWRMWLEKVKQFYETLLKQCEQIYVAGESLGGLLTLELAHQHPEIDGLFLFAPAIKVKGLWRSRLLWPLINHLKKEEDGDDNLPWQGYDVIPVKAAAELHKLQKHLQARLGEIKQPVVLFTGEFDRTIAPGSGQIIYDRIGSPIKHHFHMENSTHCVILDKELDQVAEHVLSFIETGFVD